MQVNMQCPRVSDFEQGSQNFAIAAMLISLVGIVNIIAEKLIPPQGMAATVIQGPLALGMRVNEAMGLVVGVCLNEATDYVTMGKGIDNDLEVRIGVIAGILLTYRLLANCYSRCFAYVGGAAAGGLVAAGLLAAKNFVLFEHA
jgi:hypothetical protein